MNFRFYLSLFLLYFLLVFPIRQVFAASPDTQTSGKAQSIIDGEDMALYNAMWDQSLMELKKSLSSLEAQNRQLDDYIQQLRKRVVLMEEELGRLQGKVETKPAKQVDVVVAEIKKRVKDDAITELDRLRESVRQLQREKIQLEDNVIQALRQRQDWEKEYDRLKRETDLLRSDYRHLQVESKQELRDISSRKNTLKEHITRIRTLAQRQAQLKADLAKLEAETRVLLSQKEETAQKTASKERTLMQEVAQMEAEINSLEEKKAAFQSKINAARQEERVVSSEYENVLTDEERRVQQRMALLQGENQALRQEIASLMDLIEEMKQERQRIETLIEGESGSD